MVCAGALLTARGASGVVAPGVAPDDGAAAAVLGVDGGSGLAAGDGDGLPAAGDGDGLPAVGAVLAGAAVVAVGDGVVASDGGAAGVVASDGGAVVVAAASDGADDVALLDEPPLADVSVFVGDGGALGVLVGSTAGTRAADDGGTV